jgi:integrase
MWETGVRVSELLALTPDSIDFAAEALRVATLKRRAHVRAVPLRPALLGELARHIAGRGIGADVRLFAITRQRVFQIVRGAARGAELPLDRAHPHTLRHSFAIACVLARVPVLVLAEWLGHASLEATLVYTKVLCADSRRYLGDVDFG